MPAVGCARSSRASLSNAAAHMHTPHASPHPPAAPHGWSAPRAAKASPAATGAHAARTGAAVRWPRLDAAPPPRLQCWRRTRAAAWRWGRAAAGRPLAARAEGWGEERGRVRRGGGGASARNLSSGCMPHSRLAAAPACLPSQPPQPIPQPLLARTHIPSQHPKPLNHPTHLRQADCSASQQLSAEPVLSHQHCKGPLPPPADDLLPAHSSA